jgi:hypothetical protein
MLSATHAIVMNGSTSNKFEKMWKEMVTSYLMLLFQPIQIEENHIKAHDGWCPSQQGTTHVLPMGLLYFLTSQKTSASDLFLSVSQNTQSKYIHHSYLFLSSRISLFLAWSSAIIGPPPIPPPCVTTGTTHEVLTSQIVAVYYKLGSHPRMVFSLVFFSKQ